MKKTHTLFLLLLTLSTSVGAQTATTFAAAGISQDKAYTIACQRGAFAATGVKMGSATGSAIDSDEPKQQFAFVRDPADTTRTYLYSVGQQKFLNPGNAWVEVGPQPVYLFTTGDDSYPLALSFSPDYQSSNLMLVSGGYFTVTDWTTLDDGDRLKFTEAYHTDYTLADAQRVLQQAVNVTYRIVDADGHELISQVVPQQSGSAVSLPASFYNAYVSLGMPDHTTVSPQDNVVTYTGTVHLPFTPSTGYDDATWYYLSLRGTKYAVYGPEAPYSLGKKDLGTAGQWAFTGNPYKLQVFNRKAGRSLCLNAGDEPVMGEPNDSTSWWTLDASTSSLGGFTLKQQGTANHYLNDRSQAGRLRFWDSGSATADNGSAILPEAAGAAWLDQVKQEAKDIVAGYGRVPAIFTSAAVTSADNAIAVAATEEGVDTALTAFRQSAADHPFTLHTTATGRPQGTLRDDGLRLATDTLSYESAFVLDYQPAQGHFAIRNLYTGRFVQPVSRSTEVKTDSLAAGFDILPVDTNVVALGQTGTYSFLHNDAAGHVVGWTSSATDSHWTLAPFTDAAALPGALYTLDAIDNQTVDPQWGDPYASDEYLAAREAFDAQPSMSTYRAVVACRLPLKGSDGLVNIANLSTAGEGHSIGLKTGDEASFVHGQATDKGDASQLWRITSAKQGTVRLYNVNAQKYLSRPEAYGGQFTAQLSDEPTDWTITWTGDSTFELGTGNDRLRYETGDNAGNLNLWNDNATWTYTNVATLPVATRTIGDAAYATLCYPFAVTLTQGEAYTAQPSADGQRLVLHSVGRTVHAGQPVVVMAPAAEVKGDTIEALILADDTAAIAYDDNALTGTFLPFTIAPDAEYALGQDGTTAGFYHVDGTLSNAAYYRPDAFVATGYPFELGAPTAIQDITADEKAESSTLKVQRYNLAGQRVSRHYRGIVIAGGKKLIQK